MTRSKRVGLAAAEMKLAALWIGYGRIREAALALRWARYYLRWAAR